MNAPPNASLLSVFDGRECIGFIIARGKVGFEAFDSDQRSLGTFLSQREAAEAISEKQR